MTKDQTATGAFPSTLNTSWTVASGFCVWFLCIHSPIVLAAKGHIDPLLYVHLVGSCSIYFACAHNTLLTPSSLGGEARLLHIWVGRFGLLLGIVAFASGFILTWVIKDGTKNLGFSIGVSYGGVAQMILQFAGYCSIRKYQKIKADIESCKYDNQDELFALQDDKDKYLDMHITCMVQLFIIACSIPGIIRIAKAFDNYFLIPIIIMIAYCLCYIMASPIRNRIKAKRIAERAGRISQDVEVALINPSKLLYRQSNYGI